MKAIIVVNPNAGRQSIVNEIGKVRAVFEEKRAEVEVVETESAQQAAETIRQAITEKPDVLVCCGGDGTLSQTVNLVLKANADVALGYIPAGTTNDFANSLQLPKEPGKAAARIVEGQPRRLDAGRFEDRNFIYVASFGAFTQSSYSTNQAMKNSLGHLAYVIEGIKELPTMKPYQVRAETAEGGVYEGEYVFGAVSNSTSLGGVMKLSGDQVDMADGKLELTLVKTPKNLAEFNRVMVSLMSGKYDEDMVTFVHTAGVTFTCKEPMPWSLDGEYAPGGERVEVEALPQAVRLYY